MVNKQFTGKFPKTHITQDLVKLVFLFVTISLNQPLPAAAAIPFPASAPPDAKAQTLQDPIPESDTQCTGQAQTPSAEILNRIQEQILPLAQAPEVTGLQHACLIAPVIAQRSAKRSSLIFIDVRGVDHYRQLHIPGAINLPLHALKTKPFLKQRDFVILDKGFGHDALLATCMNLRAAGFAGAKVLAGGMRAWMAQGLPLKGGALARNELQHISAAELYAERKYDVMNVITVAQAPVALPGIPAASISHVATSEELSALLEAGDPSKNALSVPVVITAAGAKYHLLQRQLGKLANKVVFVDNGIKGYQQFIAEQQKIIYWNEARKHVRRGCRI